MTGSSGEHTTFYGDSSAVDAYLAHRHSPVSSPNLVMEEPAFREEAGDVRGLRIIDLGCGDGTFGAECVAAGCDSYLGVDSSETMIERARVGASSARARFQQAAIEGFEAEHGSVDLVTARMALHYVGDLGPVLTRAHGALVEGGRLIVTVVHPVVTAANSSSEGQRTNLVVDDYFLPGNRQREWFGRPVVWQHRTTEQYVSELHRAGFVLTSLRECEPVEHLFDGNESEFQRRRRVPLFLLLHARVS